MFSLELNQVGGWSCLDRQTLLYWPIGALSCIPTGNISPDNTLVCNPLVLRALLECPLDMSKYSSWSKLLGVLIKIKEAIQRFRKLPVDYSALKIDALIFLIQIMQQTHFAE